MSRSFIHQVNVGLGVTLLLLLLNAVISYRNILRLIDNERLVRQSYQTIANFEMILSTLKDAETGQRGYLLTGNDRYLEPYNQAIVQLKQQVQSLPQAMIDPPPQIQTLEQSIQAKLTELNQTIQLRRAEKLDAALQIVRSDRGRQIMDDIRRQITTIEQQERQRQEQRTQESQKSFNFTLFTFTAVTDVSLLLLGLIAVSLRRNETQRQQAEAALRDSEQQFKAIFNQAAVGIALVAPNGTWLLVNQKLCDILGYRYEDLLQVTFQDITHPDDLQSDLAYLQQMLANQIQTYSLEKRYIRQDGTIVWINLTVSLVRQANGQPKYFISVIEDISQRRRLEEERKQAEIALRQLNTTLEQRVEERTAQLTETNQELEAFSYSISHDLRAPLRIMQGFAQALQEDYGDQLDDIAQSYIESITESAVQMDDLINDLLAYSRLSRTQIELQPVDLNYAVAVALHQLESLLQEHRAKITVTENLPSVLAHRPTLAQVITNLISNAIKFVDPSVQPQVTVTAETNQNVVRLWITDNGIGIAPEHQKRIFQVFERLHGIEAYPGTGIGLAIVQKGIDRMGGQVGLTSQLGHGSRFWITLFLA